MAGAIPVLPTIPLVIVEGNYLLMDGDWAPVRTLLDESWYIDTPDDIRESWLLARHIRFGRSPEEAMRWPAEEMRTPSSLTGLITYIISAIWTTHQLVMRGGSERQPEEAR